jgi:hypothetical protein
MANASIAQAVNRRTVADALLQARIQAAHHQAWLNALNKAALYLAAEQWQFDGDTLIIDSATTNGVRYAVTSHCCPCKAHAAGRPCWHRAACRLLVKAAEVAYSMEATNGGQDAPLYPFQDEAPTFAELTAAADELY